MHHKRHRPKHQRAGCLYCKPHKDERLPQRDRSWQDEARAEADPVAAAEAQTDQEMVDWAHLDEAEALLR